MEFDPIGWIRAPYRQKFGVPRQAGLAADVESTLELAESVPAESLTGLESATHAWIVFVFHLCGSRPGRATIRPPRLHGRRRLGVFATRSPHRPNPIGLSAVRIRRVEARRVVVTGGDFVDGTPVLDIKPYLPYADALADARCEWANGAPTPLAVRYEAEAEAFLRGREDGDLVRRIVDASLRWDPRPAYAMDGPEHVARFLDLEVRFRVCDGVTIVSSFTPSPGPNARA